MARADRVLLVVASVAACGRVGFETQAPADGAAGDSQADGTAAAPHLVMTGGAQGSANGLGIPVPAVAPGDLLVVAVVTWDGTPVAGITAGTSLSSAGARAISGSTSSELWYAAPATTAATDVAVTMGGSASGFDVFVLEFAGIAAGPPDAIAHGCLAYPPTVEVAPVTTTVPGELVVGTTMLQYPAYADTVAGPFTALPYEDGNGTAYVIAAQPGSYGPSWSVGMGSGMNAMTCSSTAAFLPAQ